MRVSLASLPNHLKQGLRPLYLLFGAEILLIEEALDDMRRVAREQGFNERLRLTVEPGFDWNQLIEHGYTRSLFSTRKMLELRLPTGRPGDAGGKMLVEYSNNIPPDNTLVIIAGAIEKRAQTSKWFKALDQSGIIVECPTVAAARLPDWVSRRMADRGLRPDREAVNHLCHLVEGNLLAAAQEIDLLALLHPGQAINSDIIRNATADHARFSVYHFVDACLGGSIDRGVRILENLKREQAEPVLVVWALTRDVRVLCQLAAAQERGQSAAALFQKFGVWRNRANLISAALKRLTRQQCENILRRLGRADMMIKGSAPLVRRDIWAELESISLELYGLRQP